MPNKKKAKEDKPKALGGSKKSTISVVTKSISRKKDVEIVIKMKNEDGEIVSQVVEGVKKKKKVTKPKTTPGKKKVSEKEEEPIVHQPKTGEEDEIIEEEGINVNIEKKKNVDEEIEDETGEETIVEEKIE
jgi:hypothetical protein